MSAMKEEYGTRKGRSVFYASINKKKAGSAKWHKVESHIKRKGLTRNYS